MRLTLWAVVACLSTPVFAQSVDPALPKARDARVAAQRAGDEQAWGRYTTDDFLVTGLDGVVKTKSQRMQEIKGNKQTGQIVPPVDEKFRVYGDTVIRTYRTNGQNGPTRFTDVWVRQGGQWRVAAVHVSKIEKP